LYFNDVQEKSNPKWMMSKQKIKKLKTMTERFLSLTDIRTKKVSRRTLYYWINKYGDNYKKSVTKEDAFHYYVKHLKTKENSIPIGDINEFDNRENDTKEKEYYKIIKQLSSHKKFLKLLVDALGKNGAKKFLADYEELSKEQKKQIRTNLLNIIG
jgi:uncharacterized HAD superfamily protein